MSRTARLIGVVLVGCTAALFVSCGSDDNDSALTGPTQIVPSTPTTGDIAPEPSGSLSVSVTWEVVASASVVAGHNQESYRFTANATGGVAPYTYRWSFGDGTEPVEGNPVIHKFYRPGTYAVVVRVRDAAGTVVRSDSGGDLQIEIVASPFSLSCHVSPTEGEAPLEVTLRAEPTGNVGPISWNWDFGDGSESDQRIASHVYDPQGYDGKARLTATATATDGQRRSVQCSREIVVSKCIREFVSSCVDGGREAFSINASGCRDTAPRPPAPPPGMAYVNIVNNSSATQNLIWSRAGGAGGVQPLAAGTSARAMVGYCPPIGSPDDGPLTVRW